MGFERRIFARTDVEIQGELQWQVKRRVGGIKSKKASMQTIDLSVDGAKVLIDGKIDLPVGASVLIMFREKSSPARVRQVLTDESDLNTQMLRLQLEQPPVEFMRIIDQWLDASAGGRKFVETTWLGNGYVADIYETPRSAPPEDPTRRVA